MQENLTCGPHLVMVEEPETKVRFRYESEGSSHGGLLGKHTQKGKKTYPSVKLVNYNGKKQVYIRVSLYTEDNEKHVLQFIGPSGKPYIDEYLQEDNTAVFTNLKFLSKKKDEICRLLMDQRMNHLGETRKSVRKRFEEKYHKEDKERAKCIMDSVKLCFEAYEESNYVRLCEPLFSNPICNQKAASKCELRIYRMSSVSGSWKGGDQVILLCNKVEKDKIQIIFYEDEDECGWQSKGIFTPADVHFQVAITFKTPPYKMNAEKTVFVCLERNGERGSPVKFTYIPDFNGNSSKKRKLYPSEETVASFRDHSHSDTSNSLSCIESPSTSVKSEDDASNFQMSEEGLIVSGWFGDEMRDMTLGNEAFDVLFAELETFSGEDIFNIENVNENNHEIIHNQNLMPVSFTEIDGGPLVGQMGALSVNELFDNIKQKSRNKASKKLLPSEKMKFQQKVYSSLMKRDDSGNTFLHVAVYKNKDVAFILKMSQLANIDIINVKNYYQETALHIGTVQNNKEVVKILLERDCNPNLKNAEGNNCYHIASQGNYIDVMCYLLTLTKYKPELNAFNYEGLTPIHIAVMKNSKECYHLLKLHSADVNKLDQKAGRSILHYAAEFQPLFVKVLLEEEEIDVNVQDFEGNTPLHLACSMENTEVVKQLLRAGADPSLKKPNSDALDEEGSEDDIFGQVPADCTTNSKVLEILKQHDKAPESCETMEKLCSLLDVNNNWKNIAIYVMDERYISSLECSPSPSKALLMHIQKSEPEDFVEYLKSILRITGPTEALDILQEKTF